MTMMLLRNLNLSNIICNGIRLRLNKAAARNAPECTARGVNDHDGPTTLIPRVHLKAQFLPFKSTQFPVRAAFAMTAHKSQGQTPNRVGYMLDL